MKIHLFTSGAADMYCGSCLRPQRPKGAVQEMSHWLRVVARENPA